MDWIVQCLTSSPKHSIGYMGDGQTQHCSRKSYRTRYGGQYCELKEERCAIAMTARCALYKWIE